MSEALELWDVLADLERADAERAREEAIARVDRNADDDWMDAALQAVTDLANSRESFTTDDVWLLLTNRGVEPPHEVRAMGAVMRRAARAGLVSKTDRVRNSVRVECHCRPVAVWASHGIGGVL